MSDIPLDTEIDKIVKELSQLPPPKMAAFAASCAERSITFYEAYCRAVEGVDFAVARRTLDLIWTSLLGEPVSKEELRAAQSITDSQLPEFSEEGPDEVIFAEYAVGCMDEAINWYLEGSLSPENIIESTFEALRIGRCLAMSKGEFYDLGSSLEGEEFERVLARDPFVVKELRLQREDLALLKSQKELSRDLLIALRSRSEQDRCDYEALRTEPGEIEIQDIEGGRVRLISLC